MWVYWLIAACAFMVVELITVSFWAIFFALAAFVTCIAATFVDNFTVQIVIFAVLSLLSVPLLRPILQKYFKINVNVKNSTTDALIGKIGVVVKPISANENGLVKIEGENWTAKSVDRTGIEEGEQVTVKAIDGVKLVVQKN